MMREGIATHNTLHAKAKPAAYSGASVVVYQEVDNGRLREAAWRKAFAATGWECYLPAEGPARAVTITWDPARWTKADAGYERTHDGMRGVSPHRYIVWVVLEHVTGTRVRVVGTHMVSGVRGNGKPPKDWRRARWAGHAIRLRSLVEGWTKAGEHVVVAGDFNRGPDLVALPAPLKLVASSQAKTNGRIDQVWTNLRCLAGIEGRKYGSDHPVVRAVLTDDAPTPDPTPDPEVPVTDDRYEITKYDGRTVDRYTAYNLDLAAKKLGYADGILTLHQGSYNGTKVSASAGTHAGGGVVDLAPYDHDRKVRVLRELGFAAWYRPAIKGLWGAHIHAVLIGNRKLAPAAARQVIAYRNGRNGLADNAPDRTWRPKVIRPAAYPSPTNVSNARDDMAAAMTALDAALADLGKIKDGSRPVAEKVESRLRALATELAKLHDQLPDR